jgi:hypothetical protein
MSTKTHLVSKIAMKTIGAQPKKNSLEEGESKELAIIYGRASKYEVGQSTFGEFTKFRGTFEAVNAETKDLYKGGACFLPDVVTSLLVDALDNSDGAPVDFALQIGCRFSTAPMGFEYTVSPLTETKESDELTALRGVALQALPAPEKVPEGEATTKKSKK